MSDLGYELLLMRGAELLEAGQIREAEATFREVIDLSKQNGDVLQEMKARLGLATCLAYLGRLNEAYSLCAEVILWVRDPTSTASFSDDDQIVDTGCLAMCLAVSIGLSLVPGIKEKNQEELEKVLEACVEAERFIHNHNRAAFKPNILILKSSILLKMGKNEEALSYAEEALSLNSAAYDVMSLAGVIFTAMNEPEHSLKVLGRLSNRNLPPRIESVYHINLAVELSEASPPKLPDALDHTRRAVAIAAACEPTVWLFVALVLHADIAGELERWKEANSSIRKLQVLLPDFLNTDESQFAELIGEKDIARALWNRLPWKHAIAFTGESEEALEVVVEVVKCLRLIGSDNAKAYAEEIEDQLRAQPTSQKVRPR